MPETPKRSGERLVRGKPKPPERDAMHQYLGQEAARLLSVYRRVKKKRGRPPRGQKQGVQAVKAAALDLLYNTGAPVSLISLFNVMLGGVVLARPDSTLPWLDLIVDYEARVNNENRLVDNAMFVHVVSCHRMAPPMTLNHRLKLLHQAFVHPRI